MAPSMLSRNQGNVRFKFAMSSMMDNNALSDSLYSYYATNEELVRSDSILQAVIGFLQGKLFSDGIQFVRDNELLVPPDDVDTHVKNEWIPFCYKSMRFIFARGFLIYTIYVNKKGIVVPDVPAFELLKVEIQTDEKTGATVIYADWITEKADRTPLYIFNSQSPFGVTAFNNVAPVDRVKPFLLQYYQLVENRTVSSYYNSRPPLIVQHPQQRQLADSGRGDLTNIDDELERVHLDNVNTLGLDNLFVQRIRSLGNVDKQTYQEMAQSLYPKPWWLKSAERQRDRPESRMFYIPHGLQFSAAPSAISDPDFLAMQGSLLENIYNSFGIPASAILNSSSKQLASGVELHKTMLFNTLKTWSGMYNIILTDIYRIIYDVKDAPVAVDGFRPKGPEAERFEDKQIAKFGKHNTFDDSTLFNKSKSAQGMVVVHLKSAFTTTPEQAYALYHEGVLSWRTYQRLRLESVGLPPMLADTSVPPPMRLGAQTMEEAVKLREEIARDKKKDIEKTSA